MERKRQRELEDGNEGVPPTSPIQDHDMAPFSADSEEDIMDDGDVHVFEDDEDDGESEDLFGDNLDQ
jgi:hypothetical protein